MCSGRHCTSGGPDRGFTLHSTPLGPTTTSWGDLKEKLILFSSICILDRSGETRFANLLCSIHSHCQCPPGIYQKFPKFSRLRRAIPPSGISINVIDYSSCFFLYRREAAKNFFEVKIAAKRRKIFEVFLPFAAKRRKFF